MERRVGHLQRTKHVTHRRGFFFGRLAVVVPCCVMLLIYRLQVDMDQHLSRERARLIRRHNKNVRSDVRKPISKDYGTRGRNPECIRGHESKTGDTKLSVFWGGYDVRCKRMPSLIRHPVSNGPPALW